MTLGVSTWRRTTSAEEGTEVTLARIAAASGTDAMGAEGRRLPRQLLAKAGAITAAADCRRCIAMPPDPSPCPRPASTDVRFGYSGGGGGAAGATEPRRRATILAGSRPIIGKTRWPLPRLDAALGEPVTDPRREAARDSSSPLFFSFSFFSMLLRFIFS